MAPKMQQYTIVIVVLHFITLSLISIAGGQYMQPTCPPDFLLLNGLCYHKSQLPTQTCPEGYYLSNNLCYRINPLPCDGNSTTKAPPMELETTTKMVPTENTTPEPETTTWLAESETTTLLPEPKTTTLLPEPETTTLLPETTTWLPEPETTTLLPEPETTTWLSEPETTTDTWLPETETTTWLPESETTTWLPEYETTMEAKPEPEPLLICPVGSILTDGHICRKVYCTQGEYYDGRCLQPVCPDGTVWRGNSCQLPSYTTTILEIENVFHNELNERPGHVVQDNKNNIYYYNSTTAASPTVIETTTTTKSWTTQRPPLKPKPTVTTAPPPANINGTNPQECCSIVTPRICKRYGQKWVCFNRRYRRCDTFVCQYPIIYLKTPKIVYDPPVLIMPPNPPLQACTTPGCDAEDTVDCSGCAHNLRESCSTYCYRYMCPSSACGFIDQQIYCSLYPGEPGCTKEDGCLWNWCGEEC